MTDSDHHSPLPPAGGARFGNTQWSIVLRAADPDSEGYGSALQELCQAYWHPLYAFVRRSGRSPQDAEDLIQSFFTRLLDKNFLAAAAPQKGRFRSFLLVTLKRFLTNEYERQNAVKRGGRAGFISIDSALAESHLGGELARHDSPDSLLEKQWATTLLGHVMARLQSEYTDSGRAALFQHLRASITRDDGSMGYAEIAEHLGTTPAAIKMAALRLRARYQVVLREEIARTVASSDEIDDEIRHLFSVFSDR
jgi:RNA polymerase sigma factor (sigma-70 family)